MHNFKNKFDKIFATITEKCSDLFPYGENHRYYPNQPKLSDMHIVCFSLLAEAYSKDSENWYWNSIRKEHCLDFINLIDRSNFNRRRKRLALVTQSITEHLSKLICPNEDIFIVDSIPVPVCQLAREKRSKICKEDFETSPDKGFSAVQDNYYYGYKLHVVTTLEGVFTSMDLTKASVHDIHYLNDINGSKISHCKLIGDKGYRSIEYQHNLFDTARIELITPMRSNQKNYKPFDYVFKKSRRRIETFFSQLCDQFMLKRNYAKSFTGLCARIIAKIAAFTLLQWFNKSNGKPINKIKFAL